MWIGYYYMFLVACVIAAVVVLCFPVTIGLFITAMGTMFLMGGAFVYTFSSVAMCGLCCCACICCCSAKKRR